MNATIVAHLLLASTAVGQDAEWGGSVELVDGVEYIHNPEKGLWDDDPAKTLTVERVFSLGSMDADEEFLFNWVHHITTDVSGNIYACDSKDNRIQVYNKYGEYLRTIGRKGKGPGELMRPMKVLIGGDKRIIVDDDLSYRISMYSPEGDFQSSFYFEGFASDIEVERNGNVLISHRVRGEVRPIVTEYDITGRIIREYGERYLMLKKDNRGLPRYAYNGLTMRDDGVLLVDFSYPYMIHFYKDGALQQVIDRDSPLFTEPEIVETVYQPIDGPADKIRTVKQRSYIWQTLLLPEGRFLTFIRDARRDYKESKSIREHDTYLDLFDNQGRFLKSYLWDWEQYGQIKHVDANGYIYTNTGDNEIVPGVTKWRVSFE